jgi:hypothetical protein
MMPQQMNTQAGGEHPLPLPLRETPSKARARGRTRGSREPSSFAAVLLLCRVARARSGWGRRVLVTHLAPGGVLVMCLQMASITQKRVTTKRKVAAWLHFLGALTRKRKEAKESPMAVFVCRWLKKKGTPITRQNCCVDCEKNPRFWAKKQWRGRGGDTYRLSGAQQEVVRG